MLLSAIIFLSYFINILLLYLPLILFTSDSSFCLLCFTLLLFRLHFLISCFSILLLSLSSSLLLSTSELFSSMMLSPLIFMLYRVMFLSTSELLSFLLLQVSYVSCLCLGSYTSESYYCCYAISFKPCTLFWLYS